MQQNPGEACSQGYSPGIPQADLMETSSAEKSQYWLKRCPGASSALVARRANGILGCAGKSVVSRSRVMWGHIWSIVFSCGLQFKKDKELPDCTNVHYMTLPRMWGGLGDLQKSLPTPRILYAPQVAFILRLQNNWFCTLDSVHSLNFIINSFIYCLLKSPASEIIRSINTTTLK